MILLLHISVEKELDDKILDLLSDKPNDYEKEFEKNLCRDCSYFELLVVLHQFVIIAPIFNNFAPICYYWYCPDL